MRPERRGAAMACALAAGALVAATAARGGPVEVIFTNIPGHPTAQVPGLPGLVFNPGVATQFDRPFASPGGGRWIMRARLAPPATASDNEVIIVGSGRTASVAVREGQPTGLLPGENIGAIQSSMGINDAGQFAFACATTGPALSNDVVVKGGGSGLQLVAREGAPAPGTGGGLYGSALDSAGILADGVPYFRAGGIQQGSRAGQTVLYRGTHVVAATGDPAFEPLGQLDDPDAPWASFAPSRFRMSATGGRWVATGGLQPPVGALAFVVDNRVYKQQNTVIPGDPLGRVVGGSLAPPPPTISADGVHWIVRGVFLNGQDFVLAGGVLAAATWGAVTLRPGESEAFDSTVFPRTFFLTAVNNAGDFIIGGVTNNPDPSADAVVVLNRQRVVLREGDLIDLNNNGIADDDAYIGVFNDDDAFLTDDLWIYFTADIRNGAGALIGQGFFRKKICKPDWNDSGSADSADLTAFLRDWIAAVATGTPLADYNRDGRVDSADLTAFLAAWLAAVGGGC